MFPLGRSFDSLSGKGRKIWEEFNDSGFQCPSEVPKSRGTTTQSVKGPSLKKHYGHNA